MTKRLRRIQAVALLLALAWGATIWWINGIPADDLPRVGWWSSRIPHFDKVVHFGMYAILGGLAWMATALGMRAGSRQWFAWGALTILIPAIMGALDEWRQLHVPGRAASIYDWYANAAGAVSAVVILSLMHLGFLKLSADKTDPPADARKKAHAELYQPGQASSDL